MAGNNVVELSAAVLVIKLKCPKLLRCGRMYNVPIACL